MCGVNRMKRILLCFFLSLSGRSWYAERTCTPGTWPFCLSDKRLGKPNPQTESQVVFYNFIDRKVPVARKWLCSYSMERGEGSADCKCDVECIMFGDCCIDAFNMTLGIEDKLAVINAMKDPEKVYANIYPFSLEASYLSLYHSYGSCHKLNINNTNITMTVIDKCPEISSVLVDPIYRERCENLSESFLNSVPVSLAFTSRWQVIFLNIFCALCHGLEEEDLVMWDTYANCRKEFNLTGVENVGELVLQSCSNIYNIPETLGKIRLCFKENVMRSKCRVVLDTDAKDRIGCLSYIAPVLFNGVSYKNMQCAYCDKQFSSKYDIIRPIYKLPNAKHPPTSGLGGATTSAARPTPSPPHNTTPRPPSMKVLFDFSFQAGLIFNIHGKSHTDENRQCHGELVYDFISNTCKPIVCPFEREWINNKCEHQEMVFLTDKALLPRLGGYSEDSFIISIESEAHDTQTVNDTVLLLGYTFKLKEVIEKYINDNMSDANFTAMHASPVTDGRVLYKSDEGKNTTIVELYVGQDNTVNLFEMIKMASKFTRLITRRPTDKTANVQTVYLSNRHSEKKYLCPEGRYLKQLRNVTTVIENGTVYLLDKRINTGFQALDTRFTLRTLAESTDLPEVEQVFICSYLQCPQIKLYDEEYSIENGTLLLNKSGERIPPKQYELRNRSVYICINKRRRQEKIPLFDMPDADLIQTVTYILSILALMTTIFIYIRSSSVRSLHGKTLVSLSISLIGGQLTSLLQLGNSTWCKIVAIIMHYSWLAAFGWMTMISFDMARTFFGRQQTAIADTRENRKRYFIYSIVGWIVPGLIVIVCIILDNVDVFDTVQIGYGKGTGCFLSGMKALFIFFNVPHMLSVLFNIVAFILTVYGISHKRMAAPGSKRSDRLFFFVYLKLFVVMGITWLFAIIASSTGHIVFWYLHFILNGLQGVFVFISFSLRANIWKKMKLKKLQKLAARSKGTTFYSISES